MNTEPAANETFAAGHDSGISVGIAGGGIIGMSIAWRLAQQGCCLVDRSAFSVRETRGLSHSFRLKQMTGFMLCDDFEPRGDSKPKK